MVVLPKRRYSSPLLVCFSNSTGQSVRRFRQLCRLGFCFERQLGCLGFGFQRQQEC